MTSNENSDYLLRAAVNNGIQDPKELANFMGQMQIESGNFNSMIESLNYSGHGLIKNFRNRNGINDIDRANEIASKGPEAVADAIYGGHWGQRNLGNTEPGDGWNYRGRGYVQLTGREEYTRVGKALGIDLVNHPDLAATRENAANIAIYYWKSKVIANEHQKDVAGATHDINGGDKSLAERKAAAAEWEAKLVTGYVAGISAKQHDYDGALRLGVHGEATKVLQADLATLGYTNSRGRPLLPDGYFGHNTEVAVRAFQSDHGLLSDGIADTKTLEAIHNQRQRLNHTPALAPELPGNPRIRTDGFGTAHDTPTQHGPRAGTSSAASAQTSNPFADPLHPDYGLYAELKERIPRASENRLAEMTAACHMAGIKPGRLGDILINTHGIVIAPYGGPGLPVVVDNTVPAPPIEQTVKQVQAYDHNRMERRQRDAQLEMTQQQSGPSLSGPGGHPRR